MTNRPIIGACSKTDIEFKDYKTETETDRIDKSYKTHRDSHIVDPDTFINTSGH